MVAPLGYLQVGVVLGSQPYIMSRCKIKNWIFRNWEMGSDR